MKTFSCKLLFLILFAIVFAGCERKLSEFKNGTWRATLKTELGVEVPFNLEVKDSAGKKVIFILNGKERFRVDEIEQTQDSVFINMPLFDSEIRAALGAGLHGRWIKHLPDKNTSMEFNAQPNVNWRFFKAKEKSKYNLGGRWSVAFTSNKDTTVAVGEFEHQGAKLTGTFLTTTGDYRYLEGTVSERKLFLSTFDGSHAYLFTADIENDSTLTNGKFYSGYSSIKEWTAKRDDKAILPDAYTLTGLKAGTKKITFSFPDLDRRMVSFQDKKFKDKVVVIQFLGSWCPNCMDETAYLSSFYNNYKPKGVEVVGLAYERTNDFDRSKKSLERLKNRFDVNYDFLVTGYTSDKKEVLKSMPALSDFNAFPTTIIVDKKGIVRKIHTGFSGPGTGEHYTRFKAEFEKLIGELLAEK